MIIALQIAIHVALAANPDNAICTHDWDCASGKCDNPKPDGGGGWYLTCCDLLGTQGCFFDGGTCCTFGSEFVSCQYPPGLFPETVCGVPASTVTAFQCSQATDCIGQTGTFGDDYVSTQCEGTFWFDAGTLGGALADFWTPFDAGPGWALLSTACSECYPPGTVEALTTGFNPCPTCCSNHCDAIDAGVVACCSGVGQVCLADNDCCFAGGVQTESCFLTTSCNPDGGEYCNPKGQVGTCAYIDGQLCTSNEQCRSGHCADAGAGLICIGPC